MDRIGYYGSDSHTLSKAISQAKAVSACKEVLWLFDRFEAFAEAGWKSFIVVSYASVL